MNRLPAIVRAVEIDGSIALVDAQVGAHSYASLMVGASSEAAEWKVGEPVELVFAETEVALATQLGGTLSMRNRFPATVRTIESGRILTRVAMEFDGHLLHALVTTRAARELDLQVGDAVTGLVKANEMTVTNPSAQ
ncbi:MAG TPA: TOBE domain-containing protein [Noviherbaspirillum sp.]|nr:TOBE domain-containing protein [Noviherbaspirillum sp.]